MLETQKSTDIGKDREGEENRVTQKALSVIFWMRRTSGVKQDTYKSPQYTKLFLLVQMQPLFELMK